MLLVVLPAMVPHPDAMVVSDGQPAVLLVVPDGQPAVLHLVVPVVEYDRNIWDDPGTGYDHASLLKMPRDNIASWCL